VVAHCPDQVYITISERCIYNCQFCSVPLSKGKIKTKEEILGIVEKARKNGKLQVIALTSGIATSPEDEIDRVVDIVNALAPYKVPIGVAVHPAEHCSQKLRDAGITVKNEPSTARLIQSPIKAEVRTISEITSPPLDEIIEVLNHESVNLYAEHLVKEIGKVYGKSGSTEKGIQCITEFLNLSGISTEGLFIEDGSGLSPLNAINAEGIVALLYFMKMKGKYFNEFYSSLPEAGKEGTLKNRFTDPVFESNLRAKSGSICRKVTTKPRAPNSARRSPAPSASACRST